MGVDTNILDYINVLNQTQIDKEDLPEFWYRVVDRLEKYKGCLSLVSVITERNTSKYYLTISYDIVDDFENGDVLRINDKTKVLITSSMLKSSGLTVVRGSLDAKYNKISRAKRAKIFTPTTVASVRGTEFKVVVADNGESIVQMVEGKLDVQSPSGKINISGTDAAEILPGEEPIDVDDVDVDTWKGERDSEFKKNPEYHVGAYSEQLKIIKERSDNLSNSVKEKAALVNAKDSSVDVEEIAEQREDAEDDMNINKASTCLIDVVISEYAKSSKNISSEYQKLKTECNKVLEVQRKNLEEIDKILKAFEEKKAEIKDKHQSAIDEIKQRTKVK